MTQAASVAGSGAGPGGGGAGAGRAAPRDQEMASGCVARCRDPRLWSLRHYNLNTSTGASSAVTTCHPHLCGESRAELASNDAH